MGKKPLEGRSTGSAGQGEIAAGGGRAQEEQMCLSTPLQAFLKLSFVERTFGLMRNKEKEQVLVFSAAEESWAGERVPVPGCQAGAGAWALSPKAGQAPAELHHRSVQLKESGDGAKTEGQNKREKQWSSTALHNTSSCCSKACQMMLPPLQDSYWPSKTGGFFRKEFLKAN